MTTLSDTIYKHVENILSDCFNFLAEQFKGLVYKETSLSFVRYVFCLHEESIKLYLKTLSGTNLHPVTEYEFAMYRRILKMYWNKAVILIWYGGHFQQLRKSIEWMPKCRSSLPGHESSRTTERYTHITNKGLNRIASPLDRLWYD